MGLLPVLNLQHVILDTISEAIRVALGVVWLDHTLEDGRDTRDEPFARFQLLREATSCLEKIMWE
jgi:hypothetical protein